MAYGELDGQASKRAAAEILETAKGYLAELAEALLDGDMPKELRQLSRTLRTWSAQILARHAAQISNGPLRP